MSELLLQTLLVLMFYQFTKFISSQKSIYVLGYTVYFILALLTKPVLYPFIFINLVLFVIVGRKFRNMICPFISLFPIIVVILYSTWNYQRTGYFHFSSISKINLLTYNSYFFLVHKEGEEKADRFIDSVNYKADTIKSYHEKSEFLKYNAMKVIKHNPVSYSFFHMKGMAQFFLDPGRFDLYNFFGIERPDQKGLLFYLNNDGLIGIKEYFVTANPLIIFALLLILITNMIKILGLLFFISKHSTHLYIRIFLFLLIFYIAFVTGPIGASRFAMPLLPFFIICFPFCFDYLKKKFANRKVIKDNEY
jgi:hypothetical protein